MAKTFYVILGFQRVGSVSFEHLLSHQFDICHDMTRLLNLEEDKRDDFVLNFPDRYEDNFESAYGFKCLPEYYPEEKINENIINNKKFKKIIMYRDNIFKSVISRYIYEKTGKFNLFEGEQYDLCEPFEVRISELIWRINEIKEAYSRWTKYAKECKAEYIEVKHEDLFFTKQKKTLNKIFKFINVEPDDSNTVFQTQKLNTNETVEKLILNFEEICAYIAERDINVFINSKGKEGVMK